MKEKIIKELIDKSPEQLTDKDIEVLLELFHEKFGFTSGIILDPQLLLDDIELEGLSFPENPSKEDRDVKEWIQLDEVRMFDPVEALPKPKNLDFMCSKPQDCSSHKKYSFSCRCIRENFSSPNDFMVWRDEQIMELGKQLQGINPKEIH